MKPDQVNALINQVATRFVVNRDRITVEQQVSDPLMLKAIYRSYADGGHYWENQILGTDGEVEKKTTSREDTKGVGKGLWEDVWIQNWTYVLLEESKDSRSDWSEEVWVRYRLLAKSNVQGQEVADAARREIAKLSLSQ